MNEQNLEIELFKKYHSSVTIIKYLNKIQYLPKKHFNCSHFTVYTKCIILMKRERRNNLYGSFNAIKTLVASFDINFVSEQNRLTNSSYKCFTLFEIFYFFMIDYRDGEYFNFVIFLPLLF